MSNNKYYATSATFFVLGVCAFKTIEILSELFPAQSWVYKLSAYNYLLKWLALGCFTIALVLFIQGNSVANDKECEVRHKFNKDDILTIINALADYNGIVKMRYFLEESESTKWAMDARPDNILLLKYILAEAKAIYGLLQGAGATDKDQNTSSVLQITWQKNLNDQLISNLEASIKIMVRLKEREFGATNTNIDEPQAVPITRSVSCSNLRITK